MSKIFFFGLFLISAIIIVDAYIDFYHLCGGIMLAQTYAPYGTLDEALVACDRISTCAGVVESSETEFRILRAFRNIKLVSGSFDYYLADRSNGTSLPNAPSATDIKVLFAIYPPASGICPPTLPLNGTTCTGPTVNREMCAEFPAFMNASFNNNACEAVTREAIIETWS
uniref:Uncharacterized protein n=1 Tax=Panagrolaimus davidi TaxID=227884 RepID=A0A914P507_9BILA